MREIALEWLYKELKKTRVTIGHAEGKPNVKQRELDDLRGKIDLLEYLCGLVTKEEAQ
jgi:hypothetical protein